jgi:uncharacterized membrane protein YphA (DoxX/SURF4 family)
MKTRIVAACAVLFLAAAGVAATSANAAPDNNAQATRMQQTGSYGQ